MFICCPRDYVNGEDVGRFVLVVLLIVFLLYKGVAGRIFSICDGCVD